MSAIQYPSFVRGAGLQNYLPAEDGLRYARAHGCTHWYVDTSFPHSAVGTWDEERIWSLRAAATQAPGIVPVIHGNFKAPLATDVKPLREAAVAYTVAELTLAADLVGPLVVHGGVVVAPQHAREARKRAAEDFIATLQAVHAEAARLGTSVWVENLSDHAGKHPFYYVFTRTAEFKEALEVIPDMQIILDVGHANVGGNDPVSMFRALHENVVALSLSDNDGRADAHAMAGRGTVDFRGLLAAIAETSWRGYVFFETRGAGFEEAMAWLCEASEEVGLS